MATYTVKAPDGKTITLQGPDGASQEDILAQAQKLYQPQTTPSAAAPAAPQPATRPAPQPVAPDKTAFYLKRYNDLRNGIVKKLDGNPQAAQRAIILFNSDPRAQKLRQLAGLAPLTSRKGEVRTAAKKSLDQRIQDAGTALGSQANGFQAAAAGISRGLFGIPEMLGAAAERFLPSAITGNYATPEQGATYSNILQMIRAKDQAAIAAHPAAGIAGEIGGALAGGGAAGKAIAGVGSRLAATGAPIVARFGNLIEGATTLRKGQKLANTGKVILAGGAAGGAQAAGTGENIPEGVATGMVAAPVIVGGAKVAGLITRPLRDFLRSSSAAGILKRFTSTTQADLEAAAAQYRARNPGEEPSVYELLPLRDQENLRDMISRMPANARERLAGHANARMADIAQGFGRQVEQRTAPRLAQNENDLAMRLAQSRGDTAPLPDEIALAKRAVIDPTDMKVLAKQEARNIMQPHDDVPVAEKFEELIPDANPVTGAGKDDQVAESIRGAAGPIRRREGVSGVTVQDITEMLSNLRNNDNLPSGVRQRAIDHLETVMGQRAPEAADAAARMREQYASALRIREGAKAGRQTALKEDVDESSDDAFQKKLNAFGTPEGATGRGMGQAYALRRGSMESPGSALQKIDEVAESPATQEAILRNLPAEAAALVASAKDQRTSAKALSNLLDPKRMGAEPDSVGSASIARMLAGLSPTAMNYTRINALAALNRLMHGIPPGRARTIVDMIFSRDPAMMQKAFRAIGNEANAAKFTKYLAGLAGQMSVEATAALSAPSANTPDGERPPDLSNAPSVADDLKGMDESPIEGQQPDLPPEAANSPYAPALLQIYQNENPDLIDLVQRVKAQESGGDQSHVSKKGAVGIMQIMPGTGPEAARLAGVPWDEKAFRDDAVYNEILGIAYLSEMLRKYDGNVNRALAAYNAGPGRVDEALTTDESAWLDNLPAETQDYVARVG